MLLSLLHCVSKECVLASHLILLLKASKFYCIIKQTKTVFHILSLSELIGASISIAHFHPHPPPIPNHHLPPPPSGGCLKMSGNWAIKQNEDEAPRRVLVLRKRWSPRRVRTDLRSQRGREAPATLWDKLGGSVRGAQRVGSFADTGRIGAGTSLRSGMLLPRALPAALCVLSCAWLHVGAASRLKSPALPIQSEQEPVPSKGLSGKSQVCRGAHKRGNRPPSMANPYVMKIGWYLESMAFFWVSWSSLNSYTVFNLQKVKHHQF